MSRKYIKQIINENFVFPNNEVSEYDLDDLVHDINDNAVSGTVTSLSATTVTSSQIVLTFNYSWSQNNAEVWVNPNGNQQLISVHMLADGQDYYKPWRMIGLVETATTGQTSYSGTTSVTGTTANMGVANFPSGVYYLEFRFIGHRAVIPACASISITAPTPTPTPTVTMTVTPTATPTPTPCIECYEYSYTASTSGLLEWLDCDGIMSDTFVASGGTYTINCPGARVGTVTGDGTIVQGALCSGCGTPTPTPTVTPTAGTPTPTPTITPTVTPTPGGGGNVELFVYSKYINSIPTGDLEYSINSGPTVNAGPVSTSSCTYMFSITGLSINDAIAFTDTNTRAIGGSTTSCPSGPGGFTCQANHTILTSGPEYFYITVDGTNAC